MSKVSAVAVHPDDETQVCGGTLLKHNAGGDKIYWLIAADIKGARGFKKSQALKRRKEIKTVAGRYGFDGAYNLNLPTAETETLSLKSIIEKISGVIDKIKPDVVYLPFYGDIHSDHRVIFEAAYSCLKPFRYPSAKKILMMETISETELAPPFEGLSFRPDHLVHVSSFLEEKLKIMEIYKGELGKHPFPRNLENIKALPTFRGATAGCSYAESFMVLREIW